MPRAGVFTARVNFMAAPADRAVWEECAQAEGVDLSTWIRAACDTQASRTLLAARKLRAVGAGEKPSDR